MKTFTRRDAIFTAAGVSALALTGLSSRPRAAEMETLRVSYAAPIPVAETTYLFAGQKRGFFAEEGIELDIQLAGGAVAAAGFIASGASDILVGGLEALPGYSLQGVDMVSPYVYAYKPLFTVGFLNSNDINSPEQLKGAKVGVTSLGSGSIPVLEYVLAKANLSTDDVELVPIGIGPSALAAVKSGAVDALCYHRTGYLGLGDEGVDITQYSEPTLDSAYPGQGFAIMRSTLDERNDLIVRFLRAVTRSLEFATNNPAEATVDFSELHQEVAGDIGKTERAWRETLKIVTPPEWAGGTWGEMSDEGWNNFFDVLSIGGVIDSRPEINAVYTTAVLDQLKKS